MKKQVAFTETELIAELEREKLLIENENKNFRP